MRISRHLVTAIVAFSLGAGLVAQRGQGTPIKPGEECPAGMTEVRPGSCQAPNIPAPSIVDYRNYHAFWKLYGIGLPDPVLKKVYYANALKLATRLPRGAWPQ